MLSIIRLFFAFMITLGLSSSAYSWTEYKNVRYMDLDGDFQNEIIVEAKHGAGTGHYIEDLRIFKDEYPNLRLVFSTRLLDSNFLDLDNDKYNYDIISDVKFTDQNPQDGRREIIVKKTKVFYKAKGASRIVVKKEDLGGAIFKWDGKEFREMKEGEGWRSKDETARKWLGIENYNRLKLNRALSK